ncbi:FCGBP protein, partial [Atractosteus spatula]|nr:FCGBP protein [Atractosteus spatula]
MHHRALYLCEELYPLSRVLLSRLTGCLSLLDCGRRLCIRDELCRVVNGEPTCVAAVRKPGTCWAMGDPHYHTFDGRYFDFMGTCTYTIAKNCRSIKALPAFEVEAKNENRGSSRVSYVAMVTVRVYGYNITVVRFETGLVRINYNMGYLPITLGNGQVMLYQSGQFAVIETDFGLNVQYDWEHSLVVIAPGHYAGSLCGLCGNFNGDPDDDFATPSGSQVSSAVDFGKSWRVADAPNDELCRDDCEESCEHELLARWQGLPFCGLITQDGGPFHMCHSAVDPKPYFDSCVYDLCMTGGFHQLLCRSLQVYAEACHRAGIAINDWRAAAQCPASCPVNSQYKLCGSACPATCSNPAALTKCRLPCVETCTCDRGFVLSRGKCVPLLRCGCTFEGRHIPAGQTFWADDSCRRLCFCSPDGGQVSCKETSCRPGEQCQVVDGVRDCYPVSYSICSACGDPHYTTFDGRHFDFQGTCIYQLVGLCAPNTTLTPFRVSVGNENRGDQTISYTKVVTVVVFGIQITLNREYRYEVMVNDEFVALPYYLDDHKVEIFYSSWTAVVKTSFGLKVTFDWDSDVTVSLPSSYAGAVCGLCGNANKNPADDFKRPDGTLEPSEVLFANSWKVAEVAGCWAECAGWKCRVCSVSQMAVYRADRYCGKIADKSGPFSDCHARIDPAPFMANCLYDACYYKGHPSAVCDAVATYAAACQNARITIQPWRSQSFCWPTCPRNSHYEVCGTGCPFTCHGLAAPKGCDLPCREGCQCDDGYVLSGELCVPIADCGCLYNGWYYRKGDVFYPLSMCQQQCVCGEKGIVSCKSFSCPREQCRVVKGKRGCYPVGEGKCVASGDPHYISFDGRRFDFQGTCTYTLAKVCDGNGTLNAFSVNVENVKYGSGNVAVTKTVFVWVYGHKFTIRQGVQWNVIVDNGVLNLPLSMNNGMITITQEGSNIIVQTDFGLKVLYDTAYYVEVIVPSSYQGKMCGLCGNYNGEPKDDFLLPNGKEAPSVNDFGTGWKVAIPGVSCSDGCGKNCPVCERTKEALFKLPRFCGVITSTQGPFSACHASVNPEPYFQHCVYDVCALNGDQQTLSFPCPTNSHYELCADTCGNTCAVLLSPTTCTGKCFEGCQCDPGFLAGGGLCVSMESCGCVYDGKYLKVGMNQLGG